MYLKRERDYTVKTVERALGLLDLFSFSASEHTFTELCRETGLGKATVKRLLYTLESHSYLDRDEQSGKYRLGLSLFRLGSVVAEGMELRNRALPYLQKLRDKTGETVILIGMCTGRQVYLEKLEGLGTVRITAHVGTVRPPTHGFGRIILAWLDATEVDSLLLPGDLPPFTINTICDRQEFLEHLRIIRSRGYDVDDEEFIEGVVGIGAPIFDKSNKAVAALGVLAPSVRMRGDRLTQVIELTKRVAQTVSQQLGSAM